MEPQSKVTRSTARHLRRKRMNLARQAAKKDSNAVHESTRNDDNESLKNTKNLQSNRILKPLEHVKSQNNQSECTNTANVVTPNVIQNKDKSSHKTDNIKHLDTLRIAISSDNQLNANKNHLDAEKKNKNDGNIEVNKNQLIKEAPLQSCKETTEKTNVVESDIQVPNSKFIMEATQKSREQIKAEREAKKAAKAAAKTKGKVKPEASDVTLQNNQSLASSSLPPNSAIAVNPTPVKSKTDNDKVIVTKTEEKSKAELRAERRAKQEAQRAAKQHQLEQNEKAKAKSNEQKKSSLQKQSATVPAEPQVEQLPKKTVAIAKTVTDVRESSHELNLFKHLYDKRKLAFSRKPTINHQIHPAIVRLGVQYSDKVIIGSNARCVAFLAVVKKLIHNFERPPQADFTRSLEMCLQESIEYLDSCRPLAVSMQNALKHLKWQMSLLNSAISDEEAKSKLVTAIDTYIREQILLAGEAISITIRSKISNGDVILTYGHSSLIHKILCEAHNAGKEFRVVIVDARPLLEGTEMLRKLVKHGIKCSYVLINALSFIMPEVSKVFLGAHAILANGAVMSRIGTAQIALMAKAFNVPVLVACETHKSSERVLTDSIVHNELGNDDDLTKNDLCGPKKSCLANWRTRKSFYLLNLTYDITPAELVTAVVTELAILPCTSVPVILRIKPSEI